MIIERNIDIFTSKQQTITNTVNRVGVMGKGLALEFKKRYYDYFLDYKIACENNLFEKEGLHYYCKGNLSILSFPTKHHWKYPSRLEWIKEGLELLSLHYRWYGITSISIPPLGCSNGGLDYKDVRKLIYSYFENHPLNVELIPPMA